MAKSKFLIDETEIMDDHSNDEIMEIAGTPDTTDTEVPATEKTSNVHQNSLDALARCRAERQENPKGAKEKKYMQLDIMEFEDFLDLMVKHANENERQRIKELNKTLPKDQRQKASVITRTRYIQDLIRKDYEEHKDQYELLKKLSEL